jgi:hypothetical protein
MWRSCWYAIAVKPLSSGPSAVHTASTVRVAAWRSRALRVEKTGSLGLRPGASGGRSCPVAPAAAMASLTPAPGCAERCGPDGPTSHGGSARPRVRGEMIQHHAVARGKGRAKTLLHLFQAQRAVDRVGGHPGSGDAGMAPGGHDGGGLPVAVRRIHNTPRAPRSAAITPCQVRGSPGLVDAHQPRCLSRRLGVAPFLTRRLHGVALVHADLQGF